MFFIGISTVTLWHFRVSESNTVSLATSESTPSVHQFNNPHLEITDEDTIQFLEMDELLINNTGLGSSQSNVLLKLGKPLQSKSAGTYPCSDDVMLTLYYPGLTIQLDKIKEGNHYRIASMDVTSSKWSVSGIDIGADIKEVQEKYKNRPHLIFDSGLKLLSYGNGDGYVAFSFQNDKLVRIRWEYNFC